MSARRTFLAINLLVVMTVVQAMPAASQTRARSNLNVDASKMDIAGLRLGMSADETLNVLVTRFHPKWNEFFCDGCTVNYSDEVNPEKHSVECDGSTSQYGVAEEPKLSLLKDGVRIEITFFHADGGNRGPCIAYRVMYGESGYLPQRDNAAFREKVFSRYGQPSYINHHDWGGYDDFYWCRRAPSTMGSIPCNTDAPILSAAIDSAGVIGGPGLGTVITLEDRKGPYDARERRTLRETPSPGLKF